MSDLSLLPAREPPLSGESLRSLVRRHALAMGYDRSAQLLSVAGTSFPPHLDHLSRGPPLTALSVLLGRSNDDLCRLTVHRFAKPLRLVPQGETVPDVCDSKTILRFFDSATPRLCPLCMAESPAFERLLWSFRGLPICTRHGCVLIESCPTCGQRIRANQLALSRCRRVCDLSNSATPLSNPEVIAVTSHLETALLANQPITSELPGAAGFWWLERLASSAARTTAWLSHVREAHSLPTALTDESVAWLAAGLMVRDWPVGMIRFLEIFQTVAKRNSTTTGVGRSFGLLLRDAQHLERLGYAGPSNALRDYLTQHFTLGHLNRKVCLFNDRRSQRESIQNRPWLTLTEAGKQLHLRHGAVAELVHRGTLDGQLHPAGKRGRSIGLISRASVERLVQEQRSAIRANEVAKKLGMSRHRVLELIHAGTLKRAVRTKAGWTVPQAEVERLAGLYRRLPALTANRRGWLSVREATRAYGRQGFTLARIVAAVDSGELTARRDSKHSTWSGLFVSSSNLRQLIPRVREELEHQHGCTLNRLAKTLIPGRPLKDVVLRKWIEAGLLAGCKHGQVWRIANTEVERFRATYCLADEAQRLLGIAKGTLIRWIDTGRILPVYSRRTHPGAGASVFRRTDVEALLPPLAI